jgi:hypothetical protein
MPYSPQLPFTWGADMIDECQYGTVAVLLVGSKSELGRNVCVCVEITNHYNKRDLQSFLLDCLLGRGEGGILNLLNPHAE